MNVLFRQKNKRTYLSLAGTLMKLMYLCLVSFFYFGRWLLAIGFSIRHAELVSASVRGEG